MEIITMKLADLRKPEKNVRIHTEQQLKEFRRSVEMFGQIRPIVVDEKNVILAGNGLYDTLAAMGKDTAEVYRYDNLTENQKKKLMIADNKIFSLGNIRESAERKEAQMQKAAPEPEGYIQPEDASEAPAYPADAEDDEEPTEIRRFVICQNCGEKIWL